MKRILFTIAMVAVSSHAYAGTKAFDIEAQVRRGVEVISDAHILSSTGKTVSVAQQNQDGEVTLLDVTTSAFATDATPNGVMLKVNLSSLVNGKKTLLATSVIMTVPGQSTAVKFAKELGDVRMNVIAQPISIKNARRLPPAGPIIS